MKKVNFFIILVLVIGACVFSCQKGKILTTKEIAFDRSDTKNTTTEKLENNNLTLRAQSASLPTCYIAAKVNQNNSTDVTGSTVIVQANIAGTLNFRITNGTVSVPLFVVLPSIVPLGGTGGGTFTVLNLTSVKFKIPSGGELLFKCSLTSCGTCGDCINSGVTLTKYVALRAL